jgi:hypothetical protein
MSGLEVRYRSRKGFQEEDPEKKIIFYASRSILSILKQSEAHWQKSMYQKAGFRDYIRQGEGTQRAIAVVILITFYDH